MNLTKHRSDVLLVRWAARREPGNALLLGSVRAPAPRAGTRGRQTEPAAPAPSPGSDAHPDAIPRSQELWGQYNPPEITQRAAAPSGGCKDKRKGCDSSASRRTCLRSFKTRIRVHCCCCEYNKQFGSETWKPVKSPEIIQFFGLHIGFNGLCRTFWQQRANYNLLVVPGTFRKSLIC